MGNFDTITSITENIKSVLQGQGIKFSMKSYGDWASVPASLMPLGRIDYTGESFEYTHGQRGGYIEALFDVSVTFKGRDPLTMVRAQQEWTHKLRSAVTVDALNIGALAVSKLISLVEVSGVDIVRYGSVSVLTMGVKVRYREI